MNHELLTEFHAIFVCFDFHVVRAAKSALDLDQIHFRQSHRLSTTAGSHSNELAERMKGATPAGAIPANVSDSDRAIVTAGFAKEVEAVNQ